MIIGGMFGLPPEGATGTAPPFGGESLFLANARSGILYVVRDLDPATIWMPSYLCQSMVEVLGELRERVRYFPVDAALQVSDIEWCEAIREGDIVCVIDYFGWASSRALKRKARSAGATVLEDACQALLTGGLGEEADFLLFSPRKYVGVPDGGVLVSMRGKPFAGASLQAAPEEWWQIAFAAAELRREFDERGASDSDRRWYELFQRAEDGPSGCYAMSSLARSQLFGSFDFAQISACRRDNYATLFERLGRIALLPAPAPSVVPLGFPVRFENEEIRERVRRGLIAEEIYPPIHWPLGDVVPASFVESHDLSRTILTLPCDQRYDSAHMTRIADAVEAHHDRA
ncbi:MAG: hypothetical protein QF890_11300 [Myxococcota bacterium]|jgi:hypothetical protein|nr:hypothetical protein [bacterium]MDP7076405.1 hypothetical protein [Myxococcota bacterium]MDP7433146.1 hypothetical protein [Myxococcota bacterium]